MKNLLPRCDGRCVQDLLTYSPQRADLRLLAIPTSLTRVAELNLNLDDFSGLALICIIATYCNHHCSTCVAQFIRAMKT